MTYTKEQLAEFTAKAAELETQAKTLEAEQSTLNEYGGKDGDRYWLLGLEIRKLRDEAKRIYGPVLDAMEEDPKNRH
jgi:hypothetical protein